jgi:hypothetical protein
MQRAIRMVPRYYARQSPFTMTIICRLPSSCSTVWAFSHDDGPLLYSRRSRVLVPQE